MALLIFACCAILLEVFEVDLERKNEVYYRNRLVETMRDLRRDREPKRSIAQWLSAAEEKEIVFDKLELLEMYLGVALPGPCSSSLIMKMDGTVRVNPKIRELLDGVKPGSSAECEALAVTAARDGMQLVRAALRAAN